LSQIKVVGATVGRYSTAGLILPWSAARSRDRRLSSSAAVPTLIWNWNRDVPLGCSYPERLWSPTLQGLPVPFVVHRADGIAGRSDTVGAGDWPSGQSSSGKRAAAAGNCGSFLS